MQENITLSNEEQELLVDSIIYELETVKHLGNTKIRYNVSLLQQLMPKLLDTRSDLVKYLDLSELKLDNKKDKALPKKIEKLKGNKTNIKILQKTL